MKISVEEFDKLNENYQNLSSQIDKLASYIMGNIEGEPSQSEGAVDCAIRLLGKQKESTIDMEYRLLKNFIAHMPKTYRERNTNWFIVQTFLQWGTRKGGATSSVAKCRLLGIDPDGYTLERKVQE